jgi:hypothetical protein
VRGERTLLAPGHPGLRLVGGGLGVTVLPQAVLDLHRDVAGIACLPLEEGWAHRRLLVCHPEGGDALRGRLAEAIARHWRGG